MNINQNLQAAACELVNGVRVMAQDDLIELINNYGGDQERALEVVKMVKEKFLRAQSGSGDALRGEYII